MTIHFQGTDTVCLMKFAVYFWHTVQLSCPLLSYRVFEVLERDIYRRNDTGDVAET